LGHSASSLSRIGTQIAAKWRNAGVDTSRLVSLPGRESPTVRASSLDPAPSE
jgi:sugar/nucleoside kinase (ribokinase family)